MTFLPFAEWKPDLTAYNAETTQVASNVLPQADGYGPVKSFGAFSQPLVQGNDSFTKILLHLNSTNFADSASGVTTPATWTAASNTATVTTTSTKYGGGALQTNGTASAYLTATANNNFAVGSSDFEADFWWQPAASNTNQNILGQANSVAGAASTSFYFSRVGSVLGFNVSDGATVTSVTGSTLTDSTAFKHVLGARKSGFLYLTINGV